MKVAVIGAVAAGTSAAAQIRYNDPDARIRVYDKDAHISYSGCGLPYYIGGDAPDFRQIVPRDAAFFKQKYDVDVFTRHEVLSVDAAQKKLLIKNLQDDSVFVDGYDVLVVATGASSVHPPIAGANRRHVFTLRTPSDALAITRYLEGAKPRRAVIVGSGFIGLEMVESLMKRGLSVTVIEKMPELCPAVDGEISARLRDYLAQSGVVIVTGRSAAEINADSVTTDDGGSIPADIVIVAVGIRPNVALAKEAGIALGTTGAIAVNSKMQTNLPDVYACGDCIECPSIIDGRPLYRPLGSTANKTGWIAGNAIAGGGAEFRGIAGTSIFKVLDLAVASTGLTEREARQYGYDVVTAYAERPDRTALFGGKPLFMKAVADRKTRRLLGAQIIGVGGVDKRIDVFAAALAGGMKAGDLLALDLAYAPPFSTAKDPLHYLGMALESELHKF